MPETERKSIHRLSPAAGIDDPSAPFADPFTELHGFAPGATVKFTFNPPSTIASFGAGAGTILDLSGRLDRLIDWQRHMDDATALHCDWAVVGQDFRSALDELKEAILDELSENTRQEPLFDPDALTQR